MTQTVLDLAFGAMTAAPDDDAARLRYFERVADAELFLVLERPAIDGTADPKVFDVEGEGYAIAFDLEERIEDFFGGHADYLSVSGRILARLLADQQTGLILNPEVPNASNMLPVDVLVWLTEVLGNAPKAVEQKIAEITAPYHLPERLLVGLDEKLKSAAGLSELAYIVATRFENGGQGHLLAFVNPAPGVEDTLANVVAEALTFSGLDAATLDVGFFKNADSMAARLAAVGLKIELPLPPKATEPPAPGMNPDQPPMLR